MTITYLKSKEECNEEEAVKKLAEFLYCLIEIKMDEDRQELPHYV